jgi:hypothetical protein
LGSGDDKLETFLDFAVPDDERELTGTSTPSANKCTRILKIILVK